MKRMFKLGWVILILGLIMAGIGYLNHGNRTIVLNGGWPRVIKQHTKTLSHGQKFTRINLSASTADVVIRQGKQYQIKYYGMGGALPTAKITDQTATVKQKGQLQYLFNINSQTERDLIVITVPKKADLAGKVKLASGDLRVSNISLKNVKVEVNSGDVNYNHVNLTGGKTHLESGDFNAQALKVAGHYTVLNETGDNTVTNTTVDGYFLQTDNGDNEMNGEDQGDRNLAQNENADNVLYLITTDGDNEVN